MVRWILRLDDIRPTYLGLNIKYLYQESMNNDDSGVDGDTLRSLAKAVRPVSEPVREGMPGLWPSRFNSGLSSPNNR